MKVTLCPDPLTPSDALTIDPLTDDLALVVVICNEAINRAESYLLRWRPREEKKSEGELY